MNFRLAYVMVCVAVALAHGQPVHADLLVGSSDNASVLRFDQTTGEFLGEFVSGGSGGLNYAFGMATGPDGNVYISSRYTHNVLRYDGNTGDFIDTFVASGSGGLNQPHGATFGPDGNLYVVSSYGHSVLRYDGISGLFVDVFASGGLSYPTDLLFGPDGNLYVSSSLSNCVVRYDGLTGAYMGVFASGGLSNTQGLAFGPADGNLYVASYNGDRVLRFDGDSGAFVDTFIAAGSGGLHCPVDITFGPDGDLYAASAGTGDVSVLRYDGTTGEFISEFVGSSGGQGYLLFKTIHNSGVGSIEQQCPLLGLQVANPYLPGSTIALDKGIGYPSSVRIYNVVGQLVKSLPSAPTGTAHFSLSWDGRDDQSRLVEAGAYFIRAQFQDSSTTKRLVLTQ